MKYLRAHVQFFISALVWLVLLQATAFWYISTAQPFICNGSGAWPLSSIPFFGTSILTLGLTLLLTGWAWKVLGQKQERIAGSSSIPFFWALLVATGVSHTIERLSSGCILDYWHFPFAEGDIYFNLGDVSLTVGVIFLGLMGLSARKKTL